MLRWCSKMAKNTENNDFQTPDWVCDFMVSLVGFYPDTILEPTPGKGNIVKAIVQGFPGATIKYPYEDFMDMKPIPVDVVIANPPFTPMAKGYEMLDRFFEFSSHVIALMPWLTIINSEKRLKILKEHGLCEIIHLPRSVFKGSRVQTCILVFLDGWQGPITFHDIYDMV